jgi:hypothetical protein
VARLFANGEQAYTLKLSLKIFYKAKRLESVKRMVALQLIRWFFLKAKAATVTRCRLD